LVICFGEVFNVVLQPLNVTLHGGQTALQDLGRHCGKSDKKRKHNTRISIIAYWDGKLEILHDEVITAPCKVYIKIKTSCD